MKGVNRRNTKPRISPHLITKQRILFLHRMGYPAMKKMKQISIEIIHKCPNEVSTPMRCIAPIKVVSKTEQSSEKYLQELPVKGFVIEAVPLSSFEHKANEPYADRANKGLFTKPPIHWQMMPKEYFGLRFAFKARA